MNVHEELHAIRVKVAGTQVALSAEVRGMSFIFHASVPGTNGRLLSAKRSVDMFQLTTRPALRREVRELLIALAQHDIAAQLP